MKAQKAILRSSMEVRHSTFIQNLESDLIEYISHI